MDERGHVWHGKSHWQLCGHDLVQAHQAQCSEANWPGSLSHVHGHFVHVAIFHRRCDVCRNLCLLQLGFYDAFRDKYRSTKAMGVWNSHEYLYLRLHSATGDWLDFVAISAP